MWFTETARSSVSLCLTGVRCSPSPPSRTAIVTVAVIRRLTATAYGPTGEICLVTLFRNAIENYCIVVGRSRIRYLPTINPRGQRRLSPAVAGGRGEVEACRAPDRLPRYGRRRMNQQRRFGVRQSCPFCASRSG